MRKWILVALVGLVLLYVFRLREGADDTLATEVLDSPTVNSCNTYWTSAIASWASGSVAGAAPSGLNCIKYAPSWVQMSKAAGTLTNSDGTPTAETKATASENASRAAANVASTTKVKNYAKSSGYADLAAAAEDTDQGPLPSAIDARASNTDSPASRSSTGSVFEDGGLFSGNAGTGQGTASGAAGPLNGNSTYGPSGRATNLNPYDVSYGTKQSGSAPRAPPGTKQPVSGPTFGGTGVSIMGGSGKTPRSEPALYGPGSGSAAGSAAGSAGGFGWGSMKSNSVDMSMLPSFTSAGSEPENQYAGTSRAPGDQDFYPPTFAQSSSYSLANASMKTDPVPFLTDFSAFQN